jgi:acyl-CoA-binding protein
LQGKKATVKQASTAYSLYKQIKEGDADEFANNKTSTPPEKYNVWLQQAGKSDKWCMLEYIVLTASVDETFDKLVKEVASGKVKEVSAQSRVAPGSGLEPPVSVP